MLTNDEREAIRAGLREIIAFYRNKTRAGKELRVSRTTINNWDSGEDQPSAANLQRFREVLSKVRERGTKPLAEPISILARARKTGLASVPLRAPSTDGAKEGLAKMSALLQEVSRGEEPAYLLELEICLLYHREEIENGVISQTVIMMAKEGAYEDAGCASWAAQRWWRELQERDRGVRESLKLRRATRHRDRDDDDDLKN